MFFRAVEGLSPRRLPLHPLPSLALHGEVVRSGEDADVRVALHASARSALRARVLRQRGARRQQGLAGAGFEGVASLQRRGAAAGPACHGHGGRSVKTARPFL